MSLILAETDVMMYLLVSCNVGKSLLLSEPQLTESFIRFTYKSFTHNWIIYFLLLCGRVAVVHLSNIIHPLFAWCVCVGGCARCHCASFLSFCISKLSVMSSLKRELEETCLTPWINITKVTAQSKAMRCIIKGSGSSVTRLNDDIVLLVLCHAWAKPVDSDNNI